MTESGRQMRELGPDEWPLFFDRLSRQYGGLPVTVQLTSEYTGIRTMARHVSLVGITVEQDGRDEEVIEVTVGDSPDALMTHTVVGPEHVLVLQPINGEDREIEIRCANGSRLLLTLEHPRAGAPRHLPSHEELFPPTRRPPGQAPGEGPFGPQPGM